jgi:hypothetical protein
MSPCIKLTPEQLKALQLTAQRAWNGSAGHDNPPTVEDLVESLTNLSVNRYQRIRELEGYLNHFLKLGKPQ